MRSWTGRLRRGGWCEGLLARNGRKVLHILEVRYVGGGNGWILGSGLVGRRSITIKIGSQDTHVKPAYI